MGKSNSLDETISKITSKITVKKGIMTLVASSMLMCSGCYIPSEQDMEFKRNNELDYKEGKKSHLMYEINKRGHRIGGTYEDPNPNVLR